MQPYFFPYIGYFQLLASVDTFVFYDDVNFIKNGWINRNRMLLAGEVRYITVPLQGASSFSKINQIAIQPGSLWREKMIESVRHAYSKAPNFSDINELLSEVLFAEESDISSLAKSSVIAISNYLELNRRFVMSSAGYNNAELNGEVRVCDICLKEKASEYFNLPSGRTLYDEDVFSSKGIQLRFIHPNLRAYPQFSEEFHPALSILDVLMFNEKDLVREMLFTGEIS